MKLLIVVPCKNNGYAIYRALASIIEARASLSDSHVAIVDLGSDDWSVDIAKDYLKNEKPERIELYSLAAGTTYGTCLKHLSGLAVRQTFTHLLFHPGSIVLTQPSLGEILGALGNTEHDLDLVYGARPPYPPLNPHYAQELGTAKAFELSFKRTFPKSLAPGVFGLKVASFIPALLSNMGDDDYIAYDCLLAAITTHLKYHVTSIELDVSQPFSYATSTAAALKHLLKWQCGLQSGSGEMSAFAPEDLMTVPREKNFG